MKITEQLLIHIGICETGLAWFRSTGKNGLINRAEFLQMVREWADAHPEFQGDAYADMYMELNSARAVLFDGGYTMQQKFHVFNPITGQYAPANSVEEAAGLRQQFISEYVMTQLPMFAVNQEMIDDEGQSHWTLVDMSGQ